ncbi:lysine methyltransferase 5Ab isoform X2 [Myripristis murdjan]|uniref:[histone H4]-lysine(20) N-methyltransferase n=1 Tax=Myripristis murdjan TaxID=586833 RepID=A0A667ZGP5_9TELE|nr:N-lysine methyltransferase KMT5A-like isoform X2 [Myripristis murdjan]
MAKGKTSRSKPEDTAEHKVSCKRETKENKPAMNTDCSFKTQQTFHSIRSPNKPRSPLSDNASTLIQEGNGSDKSHTETSKQKKGGSNEINCELHESKAEQSSETACHDPVSREQTTEKLKTEAAVLTKPMSVAGSKVSVSSVRSGAGRKVRAKKTENKASQNRKVTDYYPIRRSSRKTKAELKNEEHRHLDDLIKNGIEEGMQVKHIEGKGRGVFAVRGFKKGEFVVEYHGELLSLAEAKLKEAQYAQDPQTGCYMYYFQYQCKTYCVDATKETTRLGRLINHSKNGNCQTRLHDIDGKPHLILVASRDIEAEEELLYDYGDRSKASISAHPWLKY